MNPEIFRPYKRYILIYSQWTGGAEKKQDQKETDFIHFVTRATRGRRQDRGDFLWYPHRIRIPFSMVAVKGNGSDAAYLWTGQIRKHWYPLLIFIINNNRPQTSCLRSDFTRQGRENSLLKKKPSVLRFGRYGRFLLLSEINEFVFGLFCGFSFFFNEYDGGAAVDLAVSGFDGGG